MTATLNTSVTWSAAFAGSVAAHVGTAALVLALLHAAPVPDQPPPTSELHIETQDVAHSNAAAQTPDAPKANAASAKGAPATEGEVRQSKATAATPKQDHLAAAKPDAPTTKAAEAPAQKLATAAPPPVTKSATPPTAALKPASAPTQTVAAAAAPPATKAAPPPPTPALTASTAPQAQVAATAAPTQTVSASAVTPVAAKAQDLAPTALPAATTTAAPLPAATPTAQPLAQTAPDAPQAAQATPDAPLASPSTPHLEPAVAAPSDGDHVTAALAWTGADAQIDPVSLKAIQSFMQPGDIKAQSDQTHDALSAILSSVPCSRLQAEFNPATGSLDLRGHVPDEALKGPILKALQDQLGTGIKVNDAMLILPRPQCGALSGIADVGLPQSQDQLTNPRLIGADAQTRAYTYSKGQVLTLDLAAPDYDAYVYVDYFDADGNVIHLVPNDRVPLRLRTAKASFQVGKNAAGEPYLPVTIGAPYGQEIAAAFAASAPLYDGLRPLTEPAGPYLDWLKTQVTAARAADPKFKGEWVYFFVATKDH